jgi:hypothetical protein
VKEFELENAFAALPEPPPQPSPQGGGSQTGF